MNFFLWYFDEFLSDKSHKFINYNEFSFNYFMSNAMSSSGRPRSSLYIKEEPSPQTHFNVYNEEDRWDIIPVRMDEWIHVQGPENLFQCIIVFLYTIKSFKKVLMEVLYHVESSSLP